MTNPRHIAFGMFLLAGLFVFALGYNYWLSTQDAAYRPLHILLCGPLAIYSIWRGWVYWLRADDD